MLRRNSQWFRRAAPAARDRVAPAPGFSPTRVVPGVSGAGTLNEIWKRRGHPPPDDGGADTARCRAAPEVSQRTGSMKNIQGE